MLRTENPQTNFLNFKLINSDKFIFDVLDINCQITELKQYIYMPIFLKTQENTIVLGVV